MQLKIQKAMPEDAAILALLAQITFRQAFGHFWNDETVLRNYFKQTFSVEKIRNSILKPNNVYWLAFCDKLPVAYAKLKLHSPYEKLTDSNPAQLQKIYVLNDYTGQQIGEQLQNELFEEVIRQGIKTLWLAVWEDIERAIKFYHQHGFKKECTYHYDFEKMSIEYYVMTKYF